MSRSPAAWATLARALDVSPVRMFPFQFTRAGLPRARRARVSAQCNLATNVARLIALRASKKVGGAELCLRPNFCLLHTLPSFQCGSSSAITIGSLFPHFTKAGPASRPMFRPVSTIATQPYGLIPLRCLGIARQRRPAKPKKTFPFSKSHAIALCRSMLPLRRAW